MEIITKEIETIEYLSIDNKVFETEYECMEYEAELKAEKLYIYNYFDENYCFSSKENLIEFVKKRYLHIDIPKEIIGFQRLYAKHEKEYFEIGEICIGKEYTDKCVKKNY